MDRRNFIKNTSLGFGAILPNFSPKLSMEAMLNTVLKTVDKANDHVLVLIQLAGGNDGLNMIIPQDGTTPNLWAARSLIIPPDRTMLKSTFSKRIAFHPNLVGFRDLFDEEKIRMINSVGYPNPDFSHFKSMDIWMSASDSNKTVETGWLGRFLETQFAGYPENYPNENVLDPPAIATMSPLPLILQGHNSNFGEVVNEVGDDFKLTKNKPQFFAEGKAKKEIEFLRQSISLTNHYSTRLNEINTKVGTQKPYPNTSLGQQLKNIARMVAGGVKTKVYVASMSGFDTHANQVDKDETWKGHHANLLKELSDGMGAFMADLKHLGVSKRVIGATFSEFGRRVGNNASYGTDHGAAAPMFVFGDQAIGGITGDSPEIPDGAGPNTNLAMQYDFRSIFASILKDWFCVNQNVLETVFLKNFQYVQVVGNFDCLGVTANEEEVKNEIPNIDRNTIGNEGLTKITASEKKLNGEIKLMAYSNPFHNNLKLEFESDGGYCQLKIFNSIGQQVAQVHEGNYPRGYYISNFNGEHLPDGIYYVRYQNRNYQKVINVLKASR
jgi:uncharacterized protein (DUF1501 family)